MSEQFKPTSLNKQNVESSARPDWSRAVRFESGSEALLPVICQHADTGQVLMLGYMNQQAWQRSLELGEVVFWSRSRKALWHKGETSGNRMHVKEFRTDCDADTILALVIPCGPACHRLSETCFDEELSAGSFARSDVGWSPVARLFQVIQDRSQGTEPESYTFKLLSAGLDRVLRKLGEECTEAIIAAKNITITGDSREYLEESADLLYHWLVSLAALGLEPQAVFEVLKNREVWSRA
jgi:phosphoribosyl-AMP cyclohydrolase / phosphoribosyl-ATP pyrophosphohydrolase